MPSEKSGRCFCSTCLSGLIFVVFILAGCQIVVPALTRRSCSWNKRRSFDADGRLATGVSVKGLSCGIRAKGQPNAESIEVYLRNDRSRPLTIYRSFRVDSGQFDADSDLFVSVTNKATGKRVPLKDIGWTTGQDRHNPRSYYQMAPSEFVSDTIRLSRYYDLSRGVTYYVTVEYDHGETGFEKGGEWIEMNAWTGRCRSNRVTLRLE